MTNSNASSVTMTVLAGYAEAQPSWLTKGQIHEFGEAVAAHLNYEPGADLGSIVSALGGRVRMEPTLLNDPARSGSLYVEGVSDFTIIVPSHTSMLRDRFTIAHELGHYYLHYLIPSQNGSLSQSRVVALRKGSNRIEWEANWFAAAFLMPAGQFRQYYLSQNRDIDAVAKLFHVSKRAVEVRAQDLAI